MAMPFALTFHLRLGEWLSLADGVTEEAAFAAVLASVLLVGSVPKHYATEHDSTERAAAEVYAVFAFPLSVAT